MHRPGSLRAKLSRHAQRTLGTGDLGAAVALPSGEDLHEWLAVNTVDFFNDINLLYGTVEPTCTPASCPVMSAGSSFHYLWMDEGAAEPREVSAPLYVELLMSWTERQLSDETLFPLKPGSPFPPDFVARLRVIYKRLFRVYAHIYHMHYEKVTEVLFSPVFSPFRRSLVRLDRACLSVGSFGRSAGEHVACHVDVPVA